MTHSINSNEEDGSFAIVTPDDRMEGDGEGASNLVSCRVVSCRVV
jgi:hypothetical protein